jgi:hypothetical protein
MGMRKTYRAPLELKSGDPGSFLARFASIGPPPDHDGDITEPGAFKQGEKVVIGSWDHEGGLPVGEGTIHADDKQALVDGRFFLNTERGREHYETLKALGNVEWSYVFEILESAPGTWQDRRVRFLRQLDVWSVDPVLRGAGRDTALLAIKGRPGRLDPQDALLDIRLLEIWLDLARAGTPSQVMKTVQFLADPSMIMGDVEAELMDLDLKNLEQRLEASKADHPTNRDWLREIVEAAFPGTSAAWVEVMVEGELASLARQMQRENSRVFAPGEAWGLVMAWASAPVRWVDRARPG